MTRHNHPLAAGGVLLLTTLLCVVLPCGCSQSRNRRPDVHSQFSRNPSEFDQQKDRPASAKTLYSMADILGTQGKDKDCEFVLRRCIQQYPRFTPAYISLAELQMRQGRLTEAIDVLSKALQVRPADPVLLNNLGMCLLIHREYEKALERFIAAAGSAPASERYRANMATSLGLMGRHEEAMSLLRQILPEDKAKSNAEVLRTAHEQQIQAPAGPQG